MKRELSFESGEAAIRYARDQISEKPLDVLDDDELREELTDLDAALSWEKAKHDQQLVSRRAAVETALEHDHFDSPEHDQQGSRYLDESDNLVVLDGARWVNEAIITHYHYIIINKQNGTVDRPYEAIETIPDDEDTHWLSVKELQQHRADGTLRPAEVRPVEE